MKLVTLGKVQAVFGLEGGIKIYSWTSPKDNIFNYKRWYLDFLEDREELQNTDETQSSQAQTAQTHRRSKYTQAELKEFILSKGKPHKNGLLAFLEGVDNVDAAQNLIGAYIKIDKSDLPVLEEGEYYWDDLIGLEVVDLDENCLGKVKDLLETGANDCLVLVPSKNSIDARKRIIPYLIPEVIKNVDLTSGVIQVDWDKDF